MGYRQPDKNPIEDLFLLWLGLMWKVVVLIVLGIVFLARRGVFRSVASGLNEKVIEPFSRRRGPLLDSTKVVGFSARGAVVAGLAGIVLTAAYLFSSHAQMDSLGAAIFIGGLFLFAAYGFWRKIDSSRLPMSQEAVAASPSSVSPVPNLPSEIYAYTIRVPRTTQWNAELALRFVDQVASTQPNLLFTIRANQRSVVWEIVDTELRIDSQLLERQIRSFYPRAEIEMVLRQKTDPPQAFYRFVSLYTLANQFVAPLRYVTTIKTSSNQFDPLIPFTQSLSELQAGEEVTFTLVVVGEVSKQTYKKGEQLITQSTIHPLQWMTKRGIEDALDKIATGYDRVQKYVPEDQHVLEQKLRQKLYTAALLLQVDALTPKRVVELAQLMDSHFKHFSWIPYNAINWHDELVEKTTALVQSAAEDLRTDSVALAYPLFCEPVKGVQTIPSMILEARELACLWHLPFEDYGASRIQWASGMVEVTEAVSNNKAGLFLGTGKYHGQNVSVFLPHADRVTHLNIVGKTGTGKSTLLHHMIHQDIERGAGLAVVDPLGKLVNTLLKGSIPEARWKDVVLLDLANEAYPPPLNPLHSAKGYTSTMRVVSAIERMFEGTEQAAQMASYLRAALIPLQQVAQPTMRDVGRIFMDEEFREMLLNQVDDPETQDFWDFQYNPAKPARQRQIANPIINRIRPFIANPLLYPALCHPESLDFRKLMSEGKIILISLGLNEEAVPTQERNLIGSLLVSQLQMAATGRDSSTPFYIYIDEVQEFVTTSLHDLFSQARNFGISLITANQHLGQLTGRTLDAVMGNVGASLFFQCGADDATELSAYTKPEITGHDLMNLPRFQAVAKINVHGQPQNAFHISMLSPLTVPVDAETRAQAIRDCSRVNYTPKSREEIAAWLRDRYPRRPIPRQGKEMADDEQNYYE